MMDFDGATIRFPTTDCSTRRRLVSRMADVHAGRQAKSCSCRATARRTVPGTRARGDLYIVDVTSRVIELAHVNGSSGGVGYLPAGVRDEHLFYRT